MDRNDSRSRSTSYEPSLRELLQQASVEPDKDKLRKIIEEITARFKAGEQVSGPDA